MTSLVDPCWEDRLADEAEIAPGCRFPMTHVTAHYQVDEAGKAFLESTRTLKITRIRVDEPLPDSLFAVEFKEGEWISDQTHNPPVRYRHKAVMPPEEWAKIVDEGRKKAERNKSRADKLAALIGRAARSSPAPRPGSRAEPTTMAGLRGKVVLLDFWADWCGPCRGDLPISAALHRDLAKEGLVVLGIHPPGSKPESIRKVIEEFDLAYRILVDAPAAEDSNTWGALYSLYGVDRIPHAVVVDPQGKIVAAGTLSEVIEKAAVLLRNPWAAYGSKQPVPTPRPPRGRHGQPASGPSAVSLGNGRREGVGAVGRDEVDGAAGPAAPESLPPRKPGDDSAASIRASRAGELFSKSSRLEACEADIRRPNAAMSPPARASAPRRTRSFSVRTCRARSRPTGRARPRLVRGRRA